MILTPNKRMYLIDGYAMVYRAHFAMIRNPLITSTGLHTSALFGFVNAVFMLLLGMGLIASGFLMWIKPNESRQNFLNHKYNIYSNMVISFLLGLLAGIIGIGGGIFFAPILHLQNILPSKKISAFSSIFILVNSIAGLLGQFYKNFNTEIDLDFNEYSFLMIAVILGGQIGNYFGVKIFSGSIVRRLTSVLVIYVGIRLIINI